MRLGGYYSLKLMDGLLIHHSDVKDEDNNNFAINKRKGT